LLIQFLEAAEINTTEESIAKVQSCMDTL